MTHSADFCNFTKEWLTILKDRHLKKSQELKAFLTKGSEQTVVSDKHRELPNHVLNAIQSLSTKAPLAEIIFSESKTVVNPAASMHVSKFSSVYEKTIRGFSLGLHKLFAGLHAKQCPSASSSKDEVPGVVHRIHALRESMRSIKQSEPTSDLEARDHLCIERDRTLQSIRDTQSEQAAFCQKYEAESQLLHELFADECTRGQNRVGTCQQAIYKLQNQLTRNASVQEKCYSELEETLCKLEKLLAEQENMSHELLGVLNEKEEAEATLRVVNSTAQEVDAHCAQEINAHQQDIASGHFSEMILHLCEQAQSLINYTMRKKAWLFSQFKFTSDGTFIQYARLIKDALVEYSVELSSRKRLKRLKELHDTYADAENKDASDDSSIKGTEKLLSEMEHCHILLLEELHDVPTL